MADASAHEEAPFRPRIRARAFLRSLRPDRAPPGGPNLLAWGAFLVAVFALAKVVWILRGQDAGSGSGGALAAGGAGTTWLVIGVGALGLLAYALHRPREPVVWLKRDGLREALRRRER